MEFLNNNLLTHLGIEISEVSKNRVVGKMPVDERTYQPFGILHGGASAALAESLGSIGAHENAKEDGGVAVGLELNINHVKSVSTGYVTGVATPIHVGRQTQIWDIRIENENGQLVATSRLTCMVKRS